MSTSASASTSTKKRDEGRETPPSSVEMHQIYVAMPPSSVEIPPSSVEMPPSSVDELQMQRVLSRGAPPTGAGARFT
jgi:hypothetical protein